MQKFLLMLLMISFCLIAFACSSSDEANNNPTDGDADQADNTIQPDGDEEQTEEDDGESSEEYETAELAPFSGDCTSCHDYDALQAVTSDETKGMREQMTANGSGMRKMPELAFSAGLLSMENAFARRGRHDENAMESCQICHSFRTEDGIGHGSIRYPESSYPLVFQGEAGCAASCHGWLHESAISEGFENDEGERPKYEGSVKPIEMLQAHETAHRKLWREGMRSEREDIRVGAYNAGCGGCHNVRQERHGAMLSCLDCHRMGGGMEGELHQAHISAISAHQSKNDPENPGTLCTYCHTETDGEQTAREKAACYNCHLSGHQPLNEAGEPHFWPLGE